MKLKNKLIPLMSVVAATTCIAPIATSCGVTTSTDSTDMVDITKNYVPTIAKAKKITSKTSDTDAQDLYFQHLSENPEILAQDIYKYQADYFPTRINYLEHLDIYDEYDGYYAEEQTCITKDVVAKVGISNISFRKVTYTDKTSLEEKSFYALSCDMKYRFAFKALSIDGEYELDADLNFNASMHDIPTTLYAQPKFNPNASKEEQKTNAWRISNVFTNSTLLDAVPGWSYTLDRKDAITTTTVDEYGQKHSETTEYNRNGVITRKEQVEDLIEEYMTNDVGEALYDEFLEFDSYHLSDVVAEVDIGLDLPLNDDGAIEVTINPKHSAIGEFKPGPNWYLNDMKIFENVKTSLINNLKNHDFASLFIGRSEGYLPTSSSNFFPIADWNDHNDQYDSTNPITFKYDGTSYTQDSVLWSKSSASKYYDYSIGFDFDGNSIFIPSDVAYNPWYIHGGVPEDYLEESLYSDINEFSSGTKFTNFIAIEAGTHFGYAYADDGDESSFVCKTMEVTEDIPLVITIKE